MRFLKKVLKKKTKLSFNDDDIVDSIHKIITNRIESTKPKSSARKKEVGKEVGVNSLPVVEVDELVEI